MKAKQKKLHLNAKPLFRFKPQVRANAPITDPTNTVTTTSGTICQTVW
jgi:hypothetical protein